MKIDQIFNKCASIILSKRADYTTHPEIDNHENFKRSALIASWFKSDDDKAYAVLIGTKLARLGALLADNRTPNNESIDDSFVDLINYCALWMERRTQPETDMTFQFMPGRTISLNDPRIIGNQVQCTCAGTVESASICPVHRNPISHT